MREREALTFVFVLEFRLYERNVDDLIVVAVQARPSTTTCVRFWGEDLFVAKLRGTPMHKY